MRPDRAVVVAQRVVRRRRRSTSSARPSRTRARRPISAPDDRRRRARAARSRSRADGRCWSTVRRRAACRRRARARSTRRAPSHPERLVETRAQLCRLALEPLGELRVVPRLARDLGEPELRVVDVALHLARRDRRRREAAVVEALRVARVLPRLVLEPARGAPLVLDEAVAVAVAVLVDPAQRGERRLAQLTHERVVVRPTPCLGEQHEEQRRRIDACRSSGRTISSAHLPRRTSCTILPGSASRDGSSVVACSAASSRSAPRASSGPNSSVWRRRDHRVAPEDGHEPRHPGRGQLAAAASSPVRIRSAARSLTDWPKACLSRPSSPGSSAPGAATPRPTRARGRAPRRNGGDPPRARCGRRRPRSRRRPAGPTSRAASASCRRRHPRASASRAGQDHLRPAEALGSTSTYGCAGRRSSGSTGSAAASRSSGRRVRSPTPSRR